MMNVVSTAHAVSPTLASDHSSVWDIFSGRSLRLEAVDDIPEQRSPLSVLVLSVVAMGERRAVKQREEEHLQADQEILHGGAHLVRAVQQTRL